jgi:hypothetical protein
MTDLRLRVRGIGSLFREKGCVGAAQRVEGDGKTIRVPQHLAIAGGHVRAPVEGKGAEDYVLARDADRLVALYRRAVELDD